MPWLLSRLKTQTWYWYLSFNLILSKKANKLTSHIYTSCFQIVTMVAARWRCTVSVSSCGHWSLPSTPRLWKAPAQPTEDLFWPQGRCLQICCDRLSPDQWWKVVHTLLVFIWTLLSVDEVLKYIIWGTKAISQWFVTLSKDFTLAVLNSMSLFFSR